MDKKNSVMGNLHRLEYRPATLNTLDKQNQVHSEDFQETSKKTCGEFLGLKKAARSPLPKPVPVSPPEPVSQPVYEQPVVQSVEPQTPVVAPEPVSQPVYEQPVVQHEVKPVPVMPPAVEYVEPESTPELPSPVSSEETPKDVENVFSETPQQMSVSDMEQHLNEAMTRRIADYRMSRHDLAVRVTEVIAGIEREQNEMEQTLSHLSSVYTQLSELEAELQKECPISEADTDKQSLVGEESRKLEEMRLKAIRLIAGIEKKSSDPYHNVGECIPFDNPFDLNSLRFGQILRIGMGFFLPLLITILISAFLISIAIICAFNGAIRW